MGYARTRPQAQTLACETFHKQILFHSAGLVYISRYLRGSRRIAQGAMGRIADAWRVLRGTAELADDARYIRRDEVPGLVAQLGEMEMAVASTLEKVNAMAARMRKREQREKSAQDEAGAPGEVPGGFPVGSDPKAALRAFYGQSRLAGRMRAINGGSQ